MRNLFLLDAHCDTAYELYHRGESLEDNTCHISLRHAVPFPNYGQVYAVWSDKHLCDEDCWFRFLTIAATFKNQLDVYRDRITPVRSFYELQTAWSASQQAAFLAVEDARLLAGHLERLDILKEMGIVYLTLLWGGDSCIGGSHDTQNGLTDFGKQVVHGCYDRGILPDISHASERSTDEILTIAEERGKPLLATHSNSFSVYPHSRNLRDRHFEAIRSRGGFVGVSLCRSHLTDTAQRNATVEDVLRHIDRYMEMGGESTVGLGCDFDGTDPPYGIQNLSELPLLADAMSVHGYSDYQIENIFWRNAYSFFQKNFI